MYSPAVRMKWRLKRSDSFKNARPPAAPGRRPAGWRRSGRPSCAGGAPKSAERPPRTPPMRPDDWTFAARLRFAARGSTRKVSTQCPPRSGVAVTPPAAGCGSKRGKRAAAGCHQGRLAALSHAPWRSPRRRLRSRRSCRTCRTSRRRRPRSCRRSRRRRSLTAATPMRRSHCSRSACRPTSPSLIEHTHCAAASLSTEGPARARGARSQIA